MKSMQSKVKQAVAKGAYRSAKQSAGVFCRLWLGQEKVPKALLEPEVRQ